MLHLIKSHEALALEVLHSILSNKFEHYVNSRLADTMYHDSIDPFSEFFTGPDANKTEVRNKLTKFTESMPKLRLEGIISSRDDSKPESSVFFYLGSDNINRAVGINIYLIPPDTTQDSHELLWQGWSLNQKETARCSFNRYHPEFDNYVIVGTDTCT